MDTFLTQFATEIKRRNVVLFLGPDISESAGGYQGLPTSWQLADELAKRLDYGLVYRSLPRVAQLFAGRFGQQALVDFVQHRLTNPLYRPLPIHQLIARIPFPFIVHAGWDNLLEQALDEQGVSYKLIYTAQDLGYGAGKDVVIYKPYGSLSRPESLIIAHNQQQALPDTPILNELSSLLAKHWLLLLGYTIDYDTLFGQLYEQLRQKQGQHRPPAYVVQAQLRPEQNDYFKTIGTTPLEKEPTHFLYALAGQVAAASQKTIHLPSLAELSQAPHLTLSEAEREVELINRAWNSLGIGNLVEQSEVPLLNPEQLRDLDGIWAAYQRLAAGFDNLAGADLAALRKGNLEYVRQNYASAEQAYQQALQANPKLGEAYLNLHYLYLAQSVALGDGRKEEAAEEKRRKAWQNYQKAVEHQPALALLPARFQIEAILGQGGMGTVYRARDKESGREVAIKVLNRTARHNQKAIERFRREATILSRLPHEHIVVALEQGEYEGQQFLVMEYLGEQTLARLLAQQGQLTLDESQRITAQIAQALHTAHQAQIVHRDLKPSNVFLVNGQVKVIDFGLATDLAAGQPSTLGLATGTLRYMAPEQQKGEGIGPHTDQYTLATIFYELVSGRNPADGTYQPLSQLLPGLTPALDLVIETARQHDPHQRYPDITTFARQLAETVAYQPAAANSPAWRKALAKTQQGLVYLTQKGWYWLLLGSVGLGSPMVDGLGASGRDIAHTLSLLLWNTFIQGYLGRIGILANLAKVGPAGQASLVTYRPLFNTLLAIATTFIGRSLLTFKEGPQFYDRWDIPTYLIQLFLHGAFGLLVALFSFAATLTTLRLTARYRLGYLATALLGYGLVLFLLTLFAYIFYRVLYS